MSAGPSPLQVRPSPPPFPLDLCIQHLPQTWLAVCRLHRVHQVLTSGGSKPSESWCESSSQDTRQNPYDLVDGTLTTR